MGFLKFVQMAVEKSNKCLAAVAEVDEIFKNVNSDLKNYPAGELRLVRSTSGKAQIESIVDKIAGAESYFFRNDRIFLSLNTESGEFSVDVAGWKQRATGYPCVLKFDGQELSCGSAAHLVNGISELLSSVGFGNAVNNLTKKASEASMQKSRKTSEASQPSRLSLVSKSVQKSASSKASAKSTASTIATKPAVAKIAAKSGASKVAASKSAAKPAAPRVTASNTAAKPTASKGAASKSAAKPEASKAKSPKSTAKPATSRPIKKPVAAQAVAKAPSAKSKLKPADVDVSDGSPIGNNAGREYQKNANSDLPV